MKISRLTDPSTQAGRIFDIFVICLIIYSISVLALETMPGWSDAVTRFFMISDIVVTGIFTAEYILRIVTSKKRLQYIFSFYGLIDLIAILPFYLFMAADAQAVRTLRLLRLFRMIKLAKYNKAINRFGKALVMVKEEAVLFIGVTLVLLFLSAVGIYYFENHAQPEHFKSIPHSLWWAVTTLTTVGYGDVYPVTVGGRLFTFIMLMVGLGIIAVPAGMVASALAKVRQEEDEGDR